MTNEKIYEDLNYIKHKVDTLQQIELLSLSSNELLKNKYIEFFSKDDILRKLYVAIDGRKAQQELAVSIKVSDATITNKMKKLEDLGLIELKDVISGKKIYKYSIAEKAFGLRKILNV